jgi:hypothetical protein
VTTILPDLPPSRAPRLPSVRLRTVGVPLLVVALGLGAATAARAMTGGKPDAAKVDRPHGQQRPLTEESAVKTSVGTFLIDLPQAPRYLRTSGTNQSLLTGTTSANGRATTAVLVVEWPEDGTDTDAFLAHMRSIEPAGWTLGPTRHTRVGRYPASEADLRSGSKVVREYRFVVNGLMLGVGILEQADDPVGLDTALAALATVRVV